MSFEIESKQKFNPGDIIIKVQPQVCCIRDEFKSLFCDNCCQRSDQLKKCSKCLQMYYCDKDCQQNDWKCHKYECKVFRDPMWKIRPLDDGMRLLLRWWLCYDSYPSFSSRKHQALNGTEFCFNDIQVDCDYSVNNLEDIIIFKELFEKYGLKIDQNKFSSWFALTNMTMLFNILQSQQDIRQTEFKTVGLAIIFQIPNLIHSCLPNSNKIFQGFTMELRAMRSIEVGEKITLNLIDLNMNKRDRKMEIKLTGLPECQCDKCRLNLDEDLDYKDFDKFIKYNLMHWLGNNMSFRGLGGVNSEYVIDWQLILYLKAIYGEYHPIITRSLVRSFIYFAENSRYASKSMLKLWYKEIEPYVRVSHGQHHPYYKSFERFATNYTG